MNTGPLRTGTEYLAYSLIIPAYNEEAYLPLTLSHVHQAMQTIQDRGEIIVVDNNSTDRTAQFAREGGATVVFEPHNQISRARNRGAREARGSFFIFLDADSTLSPELLTSALQNLKSGDCCGGGAFSTFDGDPPKWALRIAALFNWLAKRFKWAAGSFVYCRRDAFFDVGGFSEKLYASEEIHFSHKLNKWGRKNGMPFVVIEAPPLVTSSRKLDYPFRFLLISCLGLLVPFSVFFKPLCWFWYKRPPGVRSQQPTGS